MTKKMFWILLSSLFIQQTIHSVSPTQFLQPSGKTAIEEEAKKLDAVAAKASQAQKGSTEMMIISPEARSKDIENAFKYLKQVNAAAKVAVKLNNGSMITNIVEINVMPGGTMIIFTINSIKGMKYQVVKIEDIDTITHV